MSEVELAVSAVIDLSTLFYTDAVTCVRAPNVQMSWLEAVGGRCALCAEPL
ncbi:hypothetical protein SAY86_027761 [Trapa natans]|uniref:Uncharacterized protein n=1 Tax=Trapa natans TaxID=22666 RepID=A0AAN7KUK2_TRANT|nr:hypothetical protein SAY86_027761 [Trapa natans]